MKEDRFEFRRRLKLIVVLGLLVGVILQGYLLKLVIPFSRRIRQRLISQGSAFFARRICAALGLRIEFSEEVRKSASVGGILSVSNHVSYLDMFIVAALRNPSFVSSVELKETPFLGTFCKANECIFVERRSRENQENEIAEIRSVIEEGGVVHFYPEAKTTDGVEVYRFRRPLFDAATQAGCAVRVLTINYDSIDGAPVSMENKDEVFWYRQNPQGAHFWNLLKYREIRVTVTGRIYAPEELRSSQDLHLSEICQSLVTEQYRRPQGNQSVHARAQ